MFSMTGRANSAANDLSPLTQALQQRPSLASARGDPASLEKAARSQIALIDRVTCLRHKAAGGRIHESTVGLGYTGAMMGILGLITLAVAALAFTE